MMCQPREAALSRSAWSCFSLSGVRAVSKGGLMPNAAYTFGSAANEGVRVSPHNGMPASFLSHIRPTTMPPTPPASHASKMRG